MKIQAIVLAAFLLLAPPAWAGWICEACSCNEGLPDADGDGIWDECDNCTLAFNPSQTDSDGDGCGNRCDPDFNQDGVVAIADFSTMAVLLNSASPPAPLFIDVAPDPPDGFIAIADFSTLAAMLNGPPGPSSTTSGTTACP